MKFYAQTFRKLAAKSVGLKNATLIFADLSPDKAVILPGQFLHLLGIDKPDFNEETKREYFPDLD